MGRITVYSADDLNSSAAKLALKARKLPFLEINLERYPQKSSDLMALSGTLAVPQVFFNTRLVGDLKSVLQELATWDSSTKYKTPKERYEKEIERFPDPINLHLAKPYTEPVPARELPVRMPSSHIKLPDGTSTTVSKDEPLQHYFLCCDFLF
jgi:glutaredoxin